MIRRGQQPGHAGRGVKGIALVLAVAAIGSVAATIPTTLAAATTGSPPTVLFRPGYNLCHAASLAAIRKAGRQRYRAGTYSHSICTWERSDLRAGIALSTHPTAVGKALMRMFKAQSGKQHVTARVIEVPQATKALLVTLPAQDPTEHTKYLLVAYSNGVIQVNMTAPNVLPTTRLKAVVRVVS